MPETTSIPTQGKFYEIKGSTFKGQEDWLSKIAGIAYGNINDWPIIWDANKNTLRSGNPNLIYPGEIIFIPKKGLRTDEADDITGKEKDDFTIITNGVELPKTAGRITRTIDTACDGWTAEIPWNPGENTDIDDILTPFKFPTAKVYLGNHLMINGLLYTVTPQLSVNGRIKQCEGFSFTADIVDSTVTQPYEARKVTLEERANKLMQSQGIEVVSEITTDGTFDRVTAKPEDTIFEHLKELARQRSALISNTRQGKLLITAADLTSEPVATIEEEFPLPEGYEAKFDGRKIFNSYMAIGQSPRAAKKVGKATDDNVPRSRLLTFSADESTPGNIDQVAEFRRNKEYIQALSTPIAVSSWYYDETNLKLWDVNQLVYAKSETLSFPDGFKFLIRQVDYLFEESGTSAVLYLVPPEVYSNDPVKLPWSNAV